MTIPRLPSLPRKKFGKPVRIPPCCAEFHRGLCRPPPLIDHICLSECQRVGCWESFADRAALSFTDRNIGVVLEGLQSAGFAETTIVALWADHVRAVWLSLGSVQFLGCREWECAALKPLALQRRPIIGVPAWRQRTIRQAHQLWCASNFAFRPLEGCTDLSPVLAPDRARHENTLYGQYRVGAVAVTTQTPLSSTRHPSASLRYVWSYSRDLVACSVGPPTTQALPIIQARAHHRAA